MRESSRTPLLDRIKKAQVDPPRKPAWVERNEALVRERGLVAVADKTTR